MNTPSAQTIENVRLAEEAAQRRELAAAEQKRFIAEHEALEYQEYLAEKPMRDAEAKRKKDFAAKAAADARKLAKEAVMITVSNYYPGLTVERRTAINNAMFSASTKNYILSGAGGVGKTTMMAALAKLGSIDGKRVLWTDGMSWEADVRRNACADFEDKRTLPVSAEGLATSYPCVICFDEIDKITRSEFLLNHLHGLIDAAIKGHHQVLVTTNLNQEEFQTLFGASLVWRLLRQPEANNRGGLGCTWVKFNG